MRKLLTSPVKMALSDAENLIYQNVLKQATELSLNLMAVKVEHRPEDFLGWCKELHRLCREGINYDLLEPTQLAPLKKMQELLEKGVSLTQMKMLRIAPWPVFVDYLQQNGASLAMDERLRLLAYVDTLRSLPLTELNELDLDTMFGRHSQLHDPGVYDFDNEWFATTRGAKVFHQVSRDRLHAIQTALAHIPLSGEVTSADYNAFVSDYRQVFSGYTVNSTEGEKAPLFPATRLLAMRRPDQFVALSASKIDAYCQGLAIAKLHPQDFDGYFNELILTLRTTAWWRHAEPELAEEQVIWRHRAILADCFLFADEHSPLSSNYLRLKDKQDKRPTGRVNSAVSRRRTKETAQAIVDRRLAEDDVPEYLKSKRDSLVHEVKNGKSVDQAISLFRAIFG